jgi:hypothetical protein
VKFFYTLPLLPLIAVTQYSCKHLPDSGVPVYLKVDTTNVLTSIAQGPNSQAISDVWVQTTSQPATNLGAYQVPVTFPVLQDSTVSFLMNAGVFESGQSNIRDVYPFFSADTFTIYHAVPGKTYTHTPVFKYLPSAYLGAFAVETFENGSGMDYDSLLKYANPSIVKYGMYCGKITVSPTDSSVTVTQSTLKPVYALPAGQEVWEEFDYQCTVPFWVGINGYYLTSGNISSVDYEQVLFLTPNPQWTHVYVKLSQLVAQVNANFYRLTFQALNPSGNAGGSVYLDNIKIVY